MAIIGKDFKYKLIDKFLTDDETKIFHDYTKFFHISNKQQFSDWIATGDTNMYGDFVMESLLKNKTKRVEEECGKKLFPTYSFWRLYTNQAELPLHDDRPSCEISVTLNLGGDKPWPIYMDENAFSLEPGQAVIYLGQKVKHYRKVFDGDYSSQVFLHYVDQEGPNKHFKLDKRIDHWQYINPNKKEDLHEI